MVPSFYTESLSLAMPKAVADYSVLITQQGTVYTELFEKSRKIAGKPAIFYFSTK
jgi:hypothetical protein